MKNYQGCRSSDFCPRLWDDYSELSRMSNFFRTIQDPDEYRILILREKIRPNSTLTCGLRIMMIALLEFFLQSPTGQLKLNRQQISTELSSIKSTSSSCLLPKRQVSYAKVCRTMWNKLWFLVFRMGKRA